ncbi:MAG: TrkH family potassium uptake protein [Actinobacteria bacterium]|nr:TrkH family potassium uptake protein [Actinomycetota bacterium]
MLVRPRRSDIKIIIRNVGKVVIGLGVAMAIPMALSLCLQEWKPALDFAIGIFACLIFGMTTEITCKTGEPSSWGSGLPTVALSWLTAMVFGAIPLYLSGHFGSFLDACFDCMSGLATTGLSIIQDLDHLAYGTNLWRHLIMFLGGQGIIVVVLTFFVAGTSGAMEMYRGEGREDQILPNVISTARFIWTVSIVYLIIGTSILLVTVVNAGLPAGKGLFHSICLFMAGFDTGGFTPLSQGIIFYHSIWLELATILTMCLGMMNFGVHFSVWRGNRRELFRNDEMKTLLITVFGLVILTQVGLSRLGAYPNAVAMFRKGFYQVISAHSGTGFMTIYGNEFVTRWGPLAFFAVTLAMGFGAAAGSTAGGIKALRINITARSIWGDIKKLLSPPDTVIVQKYHHVRDIVITNKLVHGVMVITTCYIITYIGGALVLAMYRYPMAEALFESTSACANVGLTTGITSPGMPALVKAVFILQMWGGRLEFMSVFLLIGMLVAIARGR